MANRQSVRVDSASAMKERREGLLKRVAGIVAGFNGDEPALARAVKARLGNDGVALISDAVKVVAGQRRPA